MKKVNKMLQKSIILKIALPLTIVLLCYIAYEYGYVALSTKVTELKDDREQKEHMLYKYTVAVSKRQQIASTLNFLRPIKMNDDKGIIKSSQPNDALEHFNHTLREIIAKNGGQINGSNKALPQKKGKYVIYEMEIDTLLPDVRALSDIFYEIESNALYMIIKYVDVRVINPASPRELAAKFKIAAIGVGR